jgi:hypothetical protein
MTELHENLARWGHANIDGEEAIQFVRKIWDVGEEEGYWSERGRLAADAVWVAAGHSELVLIFLIHYTILMDVCSVVAQPPKSGRLWRQNGMDMRLVLTLTTCRKCKRQRFILKRIEHGERGTRCSSVDPGKESN